MGEAALGAEADDALLLPPLALGLHHAELVHVVHHNVAPVAKPKEEEDFSSYVSTWVDTPPPTGIAAIQRGK